MTHTFSFNTGQAPMLSEATLAVPAYVTIAVFLWEDFFPGVGVDEQRSGRSTNMTTSITVQVLYN